jgi:hypothetical protein
MRFLHRDKNVASWSTGFAKPMAKSLLGQSSKELPDISLDRIPHTHLSPPDDVAAWMERVKGMEPSCLKWFKVVQDFSNVEHSI